MSCFCVNIMSDGHQCLAVFFRSWFWSLLRVNDNSDCLFAHFFFVDWCCVSTNSGRNTGFQTIYPRCGYGRNAKKHIALTSREHGHSSAALLALSLNPALLPPHHHKKTTHTNTKKKTCFSMISRNAIPCILTRKELTTGFLRR